jgi:hypothetical protein
MAPIINANARPTSIAVLVTTNMLPLVTVARSLITVARSFGIDCNSCSTDPRPDQG